VDVDSRNDPTMFSNNNMESPVSGSYNSYFNIDLRKVFEMLMKRRLSPDGTQQYENGDDAPLFGLLKQPSRLITAASFLQHQQQQKQQQKQTSSSSNETMKSTSKDNNFSRKPRLRILLVGVSYEKQRYDLDGPSNDVAALFSFFKQHFSSSSFGSNVGGDAEDGEEFHTKPTSAKKRNQKMMNNTNNNASSSSTIFDHIFDPEKDARVLHQNCEDPLLQPTATNIRKGFAWLIEDAQSNDHLIFYFSGSGALVPQLWNWHQKKQNVVSQTRKKTSSSEKQQQQKGQKSQNNSSNLFQSSSPPPPPLSTEVSQVLLPCDFDFGRRVISYREILREVYEKVAHLETIFVTTIIDAGFAVDAPNIIEQRRGAQLQDAAQELGQTLLIEERKKIFSVRTKCRCVPPPQPFALVSIGEDQESIDSPPVVMMTSSVENQKQNPDAGGVQSQPYRLGGLSPFFVSSCSPCATSYSTQDVRKYLPKNNSNNNTSYVDETINIPRNSFFFEASRGGANGCYAWDTFSRWGGGSMGVFTNAFVSILSQLAQDRRNGLVGVNWFDLLERVQRDVRRSRGGQWQHPLLWTAARAFKEQETSPFLASVFPLAHDKELDE
jgi:hypothetical protein